MASLKQLRHDVSVRSRHARRELEHCATLWHGTPGETLRAATLITGGFSAGLLFGGGRSVPINAIWRMLLAGVPAVLQELLDMRSSPTVDNGAA